MELHFKLSNYRPSLVGMTFTEDDHHDIHQIA